jgi:hypothetical protein
MERTGGSLKVTDHHMGDQNKNGKMILNWIVNKKNKTAKTV